MQTGQMQPAISHKKEHRECTTQQRIARYQIDGYNIKQKESSNKTQHAKLPEQFV
jgi:hypothetical protein